MANSQNFKLGRDFQLEQQSALVDWLVGSAQWKNFITLTFRDIVSEQKCKSMVSLLIQRIHSMYSTEKRSKFLDYCYVVGYEPQTRGSYHCHMLIDCWVDYKVIHNFWNSLAGYAWIKPVVDDERSSPLFYVTKYVLKGGTVDVYLAKKGRTLQDR